jgi:pimeloyl-ACP methyl ester carboxylesterase
VSATAQPGRDRTLRLTDGRVLAYAEWGDLVGRPVILLHGSPGSRLMCPDEAGVRLITMDRPGYGQSEPLPRVLNFVEDLESLTDALEECAVIGWSGGGPYALACGWASAGRVSGIGLVASPGPRDQMPREESGMTDAARALEARLHQGDEDAMEEVRRHFAFYAENPLAFFEAAMDADDNPDRAVLLRPADAFKAKWIEGARQGVGGVASDWRATMGWGFPIEEIEAEVHLWHGAEDPMVGVGHARYLAARLANSVLTEYPNGGHSIAISHWGEIVAAVS